MAVIEDIATPSDELDQAVRRGVNLCRRGEWQDGHRVLLAVAGQKDKYAELPSIFYSYLGHAVAREEDHVGEGIRLCRHAISKDAFVAENYSNLARTYLLAGNQRGAYKAIERGLSIQPRNTELRRLHDLIGIRKRQPLPLLSRRNPINIWLGQIRHFWNTR